MQNAAFCQSQRGDFADLAVDELLEIVGSETMNEEMASTLIMKAREHWFEEGTKQK